MRMIPKRVVLLKSPNGLGHWTSETGASSAARAWPATQGLVPGQMSLWPWSHGPMFWKCFEHGFYIYSCCFAYVFSISSSWLSYYFWIFSCDFQTVSLILVHVFFQLFCVYIIKNICCLLLRANQPYNYEPTYSLMMVPWIVPPIIHGVILWGCTSFFWEGCTKSPLSIIMEDPRFWTP